MQIYNVYQSGKRLYIDEKENPDNKIVVNKYESEQTTLRLVSDGTLPPRLYWALRNPKLSQKYFILKLINNEDLVIDTSVTATPGLWDLILVGTPDDYIIEGTDIDQSKLTYISDTFSRLFVRDNYLEELDIEEQVPHNWMVFYDEIMFQLGEKADAKDIPDKMSDLENDTNFISGVALKDDGEGNVEIVGTTFVGGETEEGEIPSGGSVEVDDELDEESTNPVQNKVLTKEVKTLKEHNTKLKETIEKLQIKVTTEKASFHNIKDSANMKVVDFGMEGKTEQKTTSGNQLIDISEIELTNTGNIDVTEVGENHIVITTYDGYTGNGMKPTNKTLKELCPSLEVGETYLLTATSDSTDGKRIYVGVTWSFGKTMVMTEEALNSTVLLYGHNNTTTGTIGSCKISNIQIQKGTTELPYEPYTGAQPSPNPNYPQEITNAGVLNPKTGRYEHKFGFVNKNHWDAEYASDVNNWVKNEWYDYLPIRVQKGATISVSYNQELNTGLGMFITISHDATQNTSSGKWLYHSTLANLIVNKRLFVAENDYIYLHCHGIIGIDGQLDKFMQYIGNDLQIEIADAPTDFTEHQSQQITLTSDRPLTMWDKMIKRDGVWGWSIWSIIHTITEDEYVTKYTKFPAKFGFNIGVGHPQSMKEDMYCNIAKSSSWGDSVGTFGMNNNYFYINFQEEEMTKEECLAKIKETPIELCYKTAEEQSFHPLPDEEQELLYNLETYYGVTNLYNDQGCPMWLCYTCDSKLYVDQKLEQINNALLSLGANV